MCCAISAAWSCPDIATALWKITVVNCSFLAKAQVLSGQGIWRSSPSSKTVLFNLHIRVGGCLHKGLRLHCCWAWSKYPSTRDFSVAIAAVLLLNPFSRGTQGCQGFCNFHFSEFSPKSSGEMLVKTKASYSMC